MIIRRLEALFGFKIDTNQFKQATSAVDRFANNANSAMGMLAGHFAIQTINDFVSSTTEAMANVGKTAGYLGLSTDALSELRYAAEKSGVSIDTLDDSMKELQIRAVDAKAGTGEAAEAFQALGNMKVTDDFGKMRKPLDLLSEVADRLQELPTQSERIWVVDSMFGDQGAEMLKMLKDGSAGVAKMRGEAKELGYVMGGDTINSAIKFRQAMISLKAAVGGLMRSVLGSVMPIITGIIDRTSEFWSNLAKGFARLNENTTIMRSALLALGGVFTILAAKAVIAFAPIIAIGALIASVAVIVDDLWVAFSGGESVIGNLFKVFKDWLQSLRASASKTLNRIWDMLPARLQENLGIAFAHVRKFFQGYITFLTTFYRRMFGFVKDLATAILPMIKGVATKLLSVWNSVGKSLASIIIDNLDAAVARVRTVVRAISMLVSDAVPDFVKKGFSAAVEYVGAVGSKYDRSPSQQALAPKLPAASRPIQNNNQSVNVAVNMKSGASPQEVGVEVSKAVRKELEKERFNAFMGVSQYAS